ncbi:hypothetical protein Taro_029653 [Colocasia esculenta]|uniref:Uncharacterized protein n=1 Tax=Colocasia esculenta TaxID=4460 RepID=A0A843VJH1_COLES|nr:hypothetical protein [Colocasia esculenta]
MPTARSTPSTGARGRGSQATVTTSLTGQALKCRAPGERLVVCDSSTLIAPNAPSKAHEDGGPRQR